MRKTLLLVPWLAFAQPPQPENAIKVISVDFGPDSVREVTVRVHNQGKAKDK